MTIDKAGNEPGCSCDDRDQVSAATSAAATCCPTEAGDAADQDAAPS